MLYLNDNFFILCDFNGNNRRAGIIISVITGSTLFKFYITDLVTDVAFFCIIIKSAFFVVVSSQVCCSQ